MLAFQYKKMPTELNIHTVRELADALKALEFAWEEIEKRQPKTPQG